MLKKLEKMIRKARGKQWGRPKGIHTPKKKSQKPEPQATPEGIRNVLEDLREESRRAMLDSLDQADRFQQIYFRLGALLAASDLEEGKPIDMGQQIALEMAEELEMAAGEARNR